MVRKIIELEKNAIKPIHYGILERAQEKLRESEQAIQIMAEAQERREYENGWSHFLDSIQEFWIRFEKEGENIFGESFKDWSSNIDTERRSDPLLNYLYHARNVSQHEIVSLIWSNPHLTIGKGFNGHLKSLKIYNDSSYEADSVSLNPSSPDLTISQSFGKPELQALQDTRNKNKSLVLPPTSHLGKMLHDVTPLRIANIAITYYQAKFDNARMLFV